MVDGPSGGRLWRRLPAELFRFTTTESSDLHVAVASVLADAAIVQPALSFDEVKVGLATAGWDAPLSDEQLTRTLDALVGWGLVDRSQNHTTAYATPEDFERRNLQYAITAHGQAAMVGVVAALEALASTASLQPAVLDAIAEGLSDLHRLLTTTPVDANRLFTTLSAVESFHQSLVDNVRQFNTELQRLLGDDATDDDVFLDVKRQTIVYLEKYVQGIDAPARRVAHALGQLAEQGPSVLFDVALSGANLAHFGGVDPAPGWLAERARRWSALRSWFLPTNPADTPRILSLTQLAEQAIVQLLRVLERRWEARHRSASLGRDFRSLADWFAASPDEASAHALFQMAFGLWPSRHAHLLPPDHEAIPSTASWADCAQVEVAPTLRSSGTLRQGGPARPVPDPSELRQRRLRQQAEELARLAAARTALLTPAPIPLSSLAELDTEEFNELLALLSQALMAPLGADGRRRALSLDGQVEIVLGPPAPGAWAELATPAGVLTAPDFALEIVLSGSRRRAAPSPGASLARAVARG